MNADGSFVYVPPAGVRNRLGGAADTFQYTLGDAGGAQSLGSVTVEIVDALVWYVHNDPAGEPLNPSGGDGRSNDPFDTLAAAEAGSAGDDVVFVFYGDGTTTGQDAGFTAKSGQTLMGHSAATHDFGGVTVQTPNAPMTPPEIAHLAGDGVTVVDVTGVTIRDLDIAGTDNGIDVTATGANDVGVAVTGVVVSAAGNQGIRIAQASSGTTTASVTSGSILSTGDGVYATAVAGRLLLDLDTHSITSTLGTGVTLDGTGGGALVVSSFSANDILGATFGNGVSVHGAVFDADPSDADFDEVNAGAWTIGASGDGVNTAGMLLGTSSAVSGNLHFTDLDVYADGGAGLAVVGSAVSSGGSPPTAGLLLTIDAGTLQTTAGPALDVDTCTVAANFDQVTATNLTGGGVRLASLAGTTTLGLVTLTTTGGTGLTATNAGVVNVTNPASTIQSTQRAGGGDQPDRGRDDLRQRHLDQQPDDWRQPDRRHRQLRRHRWGDLGRHRHRLRRQRRQRRRELRGRDHQHLRPRGERCRPDRRIGDVLERDDHRHRRHRNPGPEQQLRQPERELQRCGRHHQQHRHRGHRDLQHRRHGGLRRPRHHQHHQQPGGAVRDRHRHPQHHDRTDQHRQRPRRRPRHHGALG